MIDVLTLRKLLGFIVSFDRHFFFEVSDFVNGPEILVFSVSIEAVMF